MTRKEWLEKFVELCESGAKTLDFRRYCRIKAQHLPRHVIRLAEYRAELEKLNVVQAVEDAKLAELAEAERLKDEEDRKARELAEALLEQTEDHMYDAPEDSDYGDDEGN